MYKKYFIVTALTILAFIFVAYFYNSLESIDIAPVFAQVKGGLSTSSVNPNSTIASERTGNTSSDLITGGTSSASVTEGMTMTTSERTGNTTNITSADGGLSASSVNKTKKNDRIITSLIF